ncbi:helix-turn-helix transcriptional regulator [Saccharopolyspora gloriosae]|uniref:Transcriptional regulator with XRE-family HTH domain n=1 Tax=Saccharopolyspora gloriosae TaxID=455344 RepID=A0A840NH84_9PSEU|nr:helix-turn-helix transcriptional regulator [Saccharopolyspora gloriosae]MBB5068649.1 transcriptional regulator with XRE-family HTH domain [Saccharopolyspora gloriosae]
MTSGTGSMVSRRRLGIELRLLREQAGMSATDAAERLDDLSQTKISRLERGKVQRPRIGDIRALLELYGVSGNDAEGLLDLTRGSRGRGWWNSYSDLLPTWFHGYVGLEAEAADVINFEPQLIPGLLQTEAYVRALARTVPGISSERVERQVKVRMLRQQVLQREDPLKLWAILDEAVLRRPFGGPEVMREQLDHLVEVSTWANIVLQVLPFSAGSHPAISGGFAVLGFPDTGDTDVAYLDAHGGLYLDGAADVVWYRELFDHLRARAADPDRTGELVKKISKEST